MRATRAGGAFGEICVRKRILDEGPRQKKGANKEKQIQQQGEKRIKKNRWFFRHNSKRHCFSPTDNGQT